MKASRVETMDRKTKRLVLASLFLVIGLILPFFTGQIPMIGNMLLPMHIPVLLCGFICGWKYGLAVGGLTPLVRSVLFGMPILFPNAIGMAVELAVYGVCAGILGNRFGRKLTGIYPALILTMITGRMAWGITSFVLFSVLGNQFTWEIFFAQSVWNAIPGIAIQLIIIPLIVHVIPQEYRLNLKSSCIKRFEPVVREIRKLAKKKELIVIAIDGKCASGKSTLGLYLKEKFDANLFHMDDFFLQKHQRTEERLAEVGGNVDYERFKKDVLCPLLEGKTFEYQRFDCSSLSLLGSQSVKPKRISVIEGSYSQHPYFGDVYDLKVFMEIDSDRQLANIKKRNGEQKLPIFVERWIPKELDYFEKFLIKEKSDIVVDWIQK